MAIGKRTFQSAGKLSQHLIPGAYSRIDSIKGQGGLVTANNGVIVGQCTGGQPATLLQFNTIAEAIATLRTGPVMDAVRLAFNPGDDLIPQRLYAMRVNTGVQGAYSLLATADPMVVVTSRGYGLWCNQITVTLANATVLGAAGNKVTISYQSEPDEVFDEIQRKSFTIQYTGGACTMTIVNHSGAKTLTTSAGTFNASPITLTDYPTIGELAAFINGTTDYTCVAIAGQENAATIEIDGVSGQDINGSTYDAESTLQAISDAIDNGSAWVSAAVGNAAVTRTIPTNGGPFYLASGSEGSYTGTEWTAALLALEAEDVQFISTPDTSPSVQSSIRVHCESMSAVTGRKERQFLVGEVITTGTKATDITNAKTAAIALNSKNGLFVFGEGDQYNVDDVLTTYTAGYLACMLMGQKCALAINQPLTFKKLNLISLTYSLSESDLETLIENGVCPINYDSAGLIHTVRQVNSYQTDDLKWNEFSMVTEMYYVARDLRAYLETLFVGGPNVSLTGGVLKGAVETKLAQYQDLGLFVPDSDGIAWWNVQITISGDKAYVDFDAYITAPVNFIFVTNHFSLP